MADAASVLTAISGRFKAVKIYDLLKSLKN